MPFYKTLVYKSMFIHTSTCLYMHTFTGYLSHTATEHLVFVPLEVDPTASTSTMKFAMRCVGFVQAHALAPYPARVCLALGISAVTA